MTVSTCHGWLDSSIDVVDPSDRPERLVYVSGHSGHPDQVLTLWLVPKSGLLSLTTGSYCTAYYDVLMWIATSVHAAMKVLLAGE